MNIAEELVFRAEEPYDFDRIDDLLRAGFPKDNVFSLVRSLRQSPNYIPELGIIAEYKNEIIGYILYTKIHLVLRDEVTEIICLAPLAVSPNFQNQKVGYLLSKYSLDKVKVKGFNLVHVLGHPNYYPRFGFKRAIDYGISTDYSADVPDAIMIMEFEAGQLQHYRGAKIVFPSEFDGHNGPSEEELAEYRDER